MTLTSRHELNLTLTLKHKFYLDLKKIKIYFKIYVNFMLIYVQKVINGRTNQNYSAEPHKK